MEAVARIPKTSLSEMPVLYFPSLHLQFARCSLWVWPIQHFVTSPGETAVSSFRYQISEACGSYSIYNYN